MLPKSPLYSLLCIADAIRNITRPLEIAETPTALVVARDLLPGSQRCKSRCCKTRAALHAARRMEQEASRPLVPRYAMNTTFQ
jgi:hypothetical protein